MPESPDSIVLNSLSHFLVFWRLPRVQHSHLMTEVFLLKLSVLIFSDEFSSFKLFNSIFKKLNFMIRKFFESECWTLCSALCEQNTIIPSGLIATVSQTGMCGNVRFYLIVFGRTHTTFVATISILSFLFIGFKFVSYFSTRCRNVTIIATRYNFFKSLYCQKLTNYTNKKHTNFWWGETFKMVLWALGTVLQTTLDTGRTGRGSRRRSRLLPEQK